MVKCIYGKESCIAILRNVHEIQNKTNAVLKQLEKRPAAACPEPF